MKKSSKKIIIGYFRFCDIITMFSTIFAIIGIIFAINNRYTCSMGMLVLCGICDMFDGHFARKKNTEEERVYGFNLDSLSDITAFGVFPTILTCCMFNELYVKIIGIFFTICGLIRLAYFNMGEQLKLKDNKKTKSGFVGVPITTIAIIYPVMYIILMNCNIKKIIFSIVMLLTAISYIIRVNIPKIDLAQYTIKFLKKITNKKMVYKNKSTKYLQEFFKFCIVKMIAFLIDTSLLYILVNSLYINNFIAKIISNCSTTMSNYSLNKKIVFKEQNN